MARLLVDDTRVLLPTAKSEGWLVLRIGEDLPAWIDVHGWPEAIALDYDLEMGGGIWNGAQVARWLRDEFVRTEKPAAEFPLWDVHSRIEANNAEVESILSVYSDRRLQGLAPVRRA